MKGKKWLKTIALCLCLSMVASMGLAFSCAQDNSGANGGQSGNSSNTSNEDWEYEEFPEIEDIGDVEEIANIKGGFTVRDGIIMGFSPFVVNTPEVLEIPAEIDGEEIIGIGEAAFLEARNLRKVILPDSIKTIDEMAFYGCVCLEEINFPEGLTTIGFTAFTGCYCLESITLPHSLTEIGAGAFSSCEMLKEIVLPEKQIYIGADAFSWTGYTCDESNWKDDSCYLGEYLLSVDTDATEYSIKEGTKYIAAGAFAEAYHLQTLTIPDSVSYVSGGLFWESNFASGEDWEFVSFPQEIILSKGNKQFKIVGGNLYTKDGKTLVQYIPKEEESFVIPNEVTKIGDGAFYGCTNLKNIEIPNGVTSIGVSAFSACKGLEDISIPSSVQGIETEAFSDCSSLTDITIPEGVIELGIAAFLDCESLERVILPESLEHIGTMAFYRCQELQTIAIPKRVNKIERFAFLGTYCTFEVHEENDVYKAMDGSLYTKDGRRLIKFAHLLELEDNYPKPFILPEGVVIISEYAFSNDDYNYGYDARLVVLSDSVRIIERGAFMNSSLNVYFNEGLQAIGEYAFSRAGNDSLVVLPDSVISVGAYAFDGYGYYSYGSFILGEELTYIGENAFGDSNIYHVDTRNRAYKLVDGDLYSRDGKTLVRCSIAKTGSFTIPDGVTKIADGAFNYCSKLTEVIMPNSVTSIGNYAFSDCMALENVKISDNVKEIGLYAFSSCKSLTSVVIPDSVKLIDHGAFNYCTSLTSVVIGDGVTRIGQSAFNDCEELESVVIGKNVQKIYDLVFEYCDSLRSVTISKDNKTYAEQGGVVYNKITKEHLFTLYGAEHIFIPDDVLFDVSELHSCSMLKAIAVSEEHPLYATQDGVLYNKEKTEILCIPKKIEGKVTIPNGVTSIGSYAFYNCDSLTSVVIGDSVTSIGERAFSGCTSLTEIVIPDSVTSIGNDAFYNCDSLTSVVIGDGVTSIGNDAFYRCDSLTSVVIPDSVTSIGDDAFRYCDSLTIYCEADSQPEGWDADWNSSDCPVVWGYKGE